MGEGGWRCGGAWRMGLTSPPPPPGSRGPGGGSPGPTGGGEGGEGGGSRCGSLPPPSGPLAWSPGVCGGSLEGPGPGPPPRPAAWRRASPPAACPAGAVWHPWAPGAAGLAAVGSVWWWGGGGVGVPPPFGGAVGGPWGAGGGGSLCLGPPLCLPRAGTKAGLTGPAQSMEGVAPILHRLASACRRPDAVRGIPSRAGAGLLACRGYRGSGRAAGWGARGVQAQWHPSPGAAALSGEGGVGGLPWSGGGGSGAGVPLAGLRLSVG